MKAHEVSLEERRPKEARVQKMVKQNLTRKKKFLFPYMVLPVVVAAIAATSLFSCTQNEAGAKPKIVFKAPRKDDVVAKIAGQEITEDELIGNARLGYYEIQKKEYEFKVQRLNAILTEKLIKKEAEKAKLSPEEFIDKKVIQGKIKPSEADFKEFLKEKQVDQSKVTPQLKERIFAFLTEKKRDEKLQSYVAKLTKKNPVEAYFQKPKLGMNIATDGAPTWGSKNAKVTIVEFSDFQCPFCARAAKTMAKIKKNYKGKVNIAFKHFPLSFHKEARPAAEAAMCIHEQSPNKFWKFYEIVFENQSSLDKASVEGYAKQSGVNMDKFKSCRDSNKYADFVKQDIQYGEQIGIRSTPTFFVNGELITGAVPYEQFAEVIDNAL